MLNTLWSFPYYGPTDVRHDPHVFPGPTTGFRTRMPIFSFTPEHVESAIAFCTALREYLHLALVPHVITLTVNPESYGAEIRLACDQDGWNFFRYIFDNPPHMAPSPSAIPAGPVEAPPARSAPFGAGGTLAKRSPRDRAAERKGAQGRSTEVERLKRDLINFPM